MLDNEIVQIKKLEENTYQIEHDGRVVGSIMYQPIETTVNIQIEETERGKHYASNALYLFTHYVHEELHFSSIIGEIQKDNEIAIHVFEHCGYQREEQEGNIIFYKHTPFHTSLDTSYQPSNAKVIYFAGGCFWGMERVFQQLDGVLETKVGYANGTIPSPTYEDVCKHETGYKETVRVTFDPKIVSITTLIDAYFLCIDPTVKNAQGNDIGTQYQTGIYYREESLEKEIQERYQIEEKKYPIFFVECKKLACFYEAEEYHQDYLTKNPNGYCHITAVDLEAVKALNHVKK